VSAADDRLILNEGPLSDLREPAPVISSERVFEGKVWDIRRDTFDFGGHTIVREYTDHPGAVAVLAEETDLMAEHWSELITFHTSPGGSNETLRIFEARGLLPTQTFVRTDEEAEILVRWVPLDQVVDAILEGRLSNPILIIAVLAAHAQRR
jgi:hypothetical protein